MRARPVGRWVTALLVGGIGWSGIAPLAADEGRTAPADPLAAVPAIVTRVRAAPPPPRPPAPAATPTVVRGPEYAGALAQRLGLAYEDGGAFVLLSDEVCRVRVYPGSHVISLDGQEHTLRGRMQREMHGVLVPGPAAGIIERHVLDARARFRAPPAPAVQVKLVPVAPPAPAKAAPPPVAPVAARAPAPARTTTSPDPGWVVAPTAREWKWIVLHHSDDHSGCMAKYHQVHLDKGWENGCGYHFVIGNGSQSGDGEVEPSRRWLLQQQGAHAKTPDNAFNDHGIGICLVGDFEHGSGRPTAAQMHALVRLVQWLMDRYEIRPANVRGHCHCGATCCPGKNFPWTELRARLQEPTRPGVAQAKPAAPAARPAPAAPLALAPAVRPEPAASPAPAASVPVTAPAVKAHDLGVPPAGPVGPMPPR